jgi:hypothetical protein
VRESPVCARSDKAWRRNYNQKQERTGFKACPFLFPPALSHAALKFGPSTGTDLRLPFASGSASFARYSLDSFLQYFMETGFDIIIPKLK